MRTQEGFLVVMGLVKFQRVMRKLAPAKAPHWLALHLAVRDLEEAKDRLLTVTKGGTYEGYTSVLGVRSNSSRAVPESDGLQRRQGVSRSGDGRHHQPKREDERSMFVQL